MFMIVITIAQEVQFYFVWLRPIRIIFGTKSWAKKSHKRKKNHAQRLEYQSSIQLQLAVRCMIVSVVFFFCFSLGVIVSVCVLFWVCVPSAWDDG